MTKGPISIKRGKGKNDWMSFEPQMSKDGKTFVMRTEAGEKKSYYDYLHELAEHVLKEIERIEEPSSKQFS